MSENRIAKHKLFEQGFGIGSMVRIFEDPITCKKLEGVAEIIKVVGMGSDDFLVECIVRFLGEGDFLRQVNIYNAD